MKKKHIGKLHRPHHIKGVAKDSLAHHTHQAGNKAHGTGAGFGPKDGSHNMGETKKSHLGRNITEC